MEAEGGQDGSAELAVPVLDVQVGEEEQSQLVQQ